jgi:hypothetical protein
MLGANSFGIMNNHTLLVSDVLSPRIIHYCNDNTNTVMSA